MYFWLFRFDHTSSSTTRFQTIPAWLRLLKTLSDLFRFAETRSILVYRAVQRKSGPETMSIPDSIRAEYAVKKIQERRGFRFFIKLYTKKYYCYLFSLFLWKLSLLGALSGSWAKGKHSQLHSPRQACMFTNSWNSFTGFKILSDSLWLPPSF